MKNDSQFNLDRDLAETQATVFLGNHRTEVYNRLRYSRELLARILNFPKMSFLVLVPDPTATAVVPSYELVGKGLTVGRGQEADWKIPDTSTRLSNKHFRVVAGREGYVVQDLSSTNGTYLNECTKRIKRAVLCNGDVILAGNRRFLFALGSSELDNG